MRPDGGAVVLSQPVKPGRVKRFHSKSRDGCATCKRRKVKCDSVKPLCWRCRNGGFQCRWPISHDRTVNSLWGSPYAFSASAETQIHFYQSGDVARAHEFYGLKTSPRLLSYFLEMVQCFVYSQVIVKSTSRQGSRFFINMIHAASDKNLIVRKFLTAMSSLDEWVVFGTNAPWKNPNFIKYYAEAISEIKEEHDQLPLDILLICCLLSAHCEYLLGNFNSGGMQMRAGARLLADHKAMKGKSLSYDVQDTLEPIFDAFDYKVKLLQLDENTFTVEDPASLPSDVAGLIPYVDICEANQALRQICFYVLAIEETNRNHRSHLVPVVTGIHQFSNNWAIKFDQYCVRTTGSDEIWKDLLRAHYQMMVIMLDIRVVSIDKIQHVEESFRKLLVALSRFITVTQNGSHLFDPSINPLPMQVGLIAPLFFTCLFCPLLDLCRLALSILGNLRLREGSWNSCVAYQIARIIVEQRETMRPVVYGKGVAVKGIRVPSVEFRNAGSFGRETLTLVFVTGDHADEKLRYNAPLKDPVCRYEETWLWPISRIINVGGYQGFVQSEPLEGCCHPR